MTVIHMNDFQRAAMTAYRTLRAHLEPLRGRYTTCMCCGSAIAPSLLPNLCPSPGCFADPAARLAAASQGYRRSLRVVPSAGYRSGHDSGRDSGHPVPAAPGHHSPILETACTALGAPPLSSLQRSS